MAIDLNFIFKSGILLQRLARLVSKLKLDRKLAHRDRRRFMSEFGGARA